MRREPQNASHDGAECKLHLRRLFKGLDVSEHACDADTCKGNGIVEQELCGVDDPGILDCLQNAVDEAGKDAFLCPEHVRIDHEGKKGGDGDGTALRELDNADIGERKAHGDTDRGIGDGFAVKAFLALVEEESRDDDDGEQKNCGDVEDKLIDLCARFLTVVIAVCVDVLCIVDAHTYEGGNKSGARETARNDENGAAALHNKSDGAPADDSNENDERREQHFDDTVFREGESKHGDSDGACVNDCGDQRAFQKLFADVAFDQHSADDKCEQERDRQPEEDAASDVFGRIKQNGVPFGGIPDGLCRIRQQGRKHRTTPFIRLLNFCQNKKPAQKA